jgi:hypothetical protein
MVDHSIPLWLTGEPCLLDAYGVWLGWMNDSDQKWGSLAVAREMTSWFCQY